MTETTLPDPQVVAWMREYRRSNPEHLALDAVQAYLADLSTHSPIAAARARHRLAPLVSAWSAAKAPLTVADIPAGQGPASLYIGRASDGCPVLTFKDEDGDLIVLEHGNPTTPSGRAYWDHLAATLPTVTTEEEV